MKRAGNAREQRGFSLLETLVVLVIASVVGGFAIVGYTQINRHLRIAGDLRDLNGIVAQAKLGAAADFTHARAFVDLRANTFHLETWSRAANCWQTVGDIPIRCTVAGTSPVTALSSGVTFGFGGVGAPPPNTQPFIAQSGPCRTGTPGSPGGSGVVIANAACIVFDSRGVSITSTTGTPTGNRALYVTDGNTVYGVTVSATGLAKTWATSANANNGNWYPR